MMDSWELAEAIESGTVSPMPNQMVITIRYKGSSVSRMFIPGEVWDSEALRLITRTVHNLIWLLDCTAALAGDSGEPAPGDSATYTDG